jgi:hypothetical protein
MLGLSIKVSGFGFWVRSRIRFQGSGKGLTRMNLPFQRVSLEPKTVFFLPFKTKTKT